MLITNKQFITLTNAEGGRCASIYLPGTGEGDGQKERKRFGELLDEVNGKLTERGSSKEEAGQFLQQGYELLDDSEFWLTLTAGLAVYVSEKGMEHYVLPLEVDPFTYVGHRFYLRPILPILSGEGRFFMLALGSENIRFYEGTEHSLRPIMIENLIPVDFAEAMETAYEKSDVRMYTGEGPTAKPIQHTRGEQAPKEIREIRAYFRQIDEGLMNILEEQRVPLILAAPERLVPIYQELTNYPDTANYFVEGDPEDKSAEYLHQRAWKKLQDEQKTIRQQYKKQFPGLLEEDKASFDEPTILKTAEKGDVAILFLRKKDHEWGAFKDGEVEIHKSRRPDSIDLMDAAAVQTYLHGGKVFQLDQEEMPRPAAKMNAVFS